MSAAAWAQWRAERDTAASAPYGIASLDRTEWLDAASRELAGLPGRWRLNDGVVEGILPDQTVRIEPGHEAELVGLRLRNFAREGGHALRVFDPRSTNRATLTGIDAYPYDVDWVVSGTFHRVDGEQGVDVTAVDGVVSRAKLAGAITLETPSGPAELTVTWGYGGGLSAVLADSTSGDETYRFRFLEATAEGDRATVDFNRASLPPCAFSPEYVCPLPLPGNRWSIPVRAGERNALRAG